MPKKLNKTTTSTVFTSSTNVVLKSIGGNSMVQLQCASEDACANLIDIINENCHSEKSTAVCPNSTLAYPPINDCGQYCTEEWSSYDDENPGTAYQSGTFCTSLGQVAQFNCEGFVNRNLTNCAAVQTVGFCSTPYSPSQPVVGYALAVAALIASGFGIFHVINRCRKRPNNQVQAPALQLPLIRRNSL